MSILVTLFTFVASYLVLTIPVNNLPARVLLDSSVTAAILYGVTIGFDEFYIHQLPAPLLLATPVTHPVTRASSSRDSPAPPVPLSLPSPSHTSVSFAPSEDDATDSPPPPVELPTPRDTACPAVPSPVAARQPPEPPAVPVDVSKASVSSTQPSALLRHLSRVRFSAADLSMRKLLFAIKDLGIVNIGACLRIPSLSAAVDIFTPLLDASISSYTRARSYMAVLLNMHHDLAATATVDGRNTTDTTADFARDTSSVETPTLKPTPTRTSIPQRSMTELDLVVVGPQSFSWRGFSEMLGTTMAFVLEGLFDLIRLWIYESVTRHWAQPLGALQGLLEQIALFITLMQLWRGSTVVTAQNGILAESFQQCAVPEQREMGRGFNHIVWGQLVSVKEVVVWSPSEVDGVTPDVAPNAWFVFATELASTLRPGLDLILTVACFLFRCSLPERRGMDRSFDPVWIGRVASVVDVVFWSPLEVDGTMPNTPPNAWLGLVADCQLAAHSALKSVKMQATDHIIKLTILAEHFRDHVDRLVSITSMALSKHAGSAVKKGKIFLCFASHFLNNRHDRFKKKADEAFNWASALGQRARVGGTCIWIDASARGRTVMESATACARMVSVIAHTTLALARDERQLRQIHDSFQPSMLCWLASLAIIIQWSPPDPSDVRVAFKWLIDNLRWRRTGRIKGLGIGSWEYAMAPVNAYAGLSHISMRETQLTSPIASRPMPDVAGFQAPLLSPDSPIPAADISTPYSPVRKARKKRSRSKKTASLSTPAAPEERPQSNMHVYRILHDEEGPWTAVCHQKKTRRRQMSASSDSSSRN